MNLLGAHLCERQAESRSDTVRCEHGEEGIKVRDWFRSYDLKWSEVQRFDLEQEFDWRGNRSSGMSYSRMARGSFSRAEWR